MRNLAFFVVLLMTAGCASTLTPVAVSPSKPDLPESKLDQHAMMIGAWRGEAPLKEGGTKKWLVQRSADGTYQIAFLIESTDGEIERSQEVGFWGVSGPIYFTIMKGWVTDGEFRPSDPTNAYFYDAYQIVSMTPDRFEYQSYASGSRYLLERVPDGFSPEDL